MDGDRFDDLSRRLAAGLSRRKVVKGAVAGALGALGLRTAADAQVTQAYCGNVACQGNACVCKPGCVCCSYSNSNSRCRPPGTCSSGTESVCAPPTTTPAPTTTTTTTTTTAFRLPTQGTCPAGMNTCNGGAGNCNGTTECFCEQSFDGGTVCTGASGECSACTSHVDCAAFGSGAACVDFGVGTCTNLCGGTGGRACKVGCPN